MTIEPDDIPREPKALARFIDGIPMMPIEGAGANSGDPPDMLYATHQGVLRIGDVELKVYRLNDGTRVFDADDVHRFFGVTGGNES